jgi:molecular chaperone GrpE
MDSGRINIPIRVVRADDGQGTDPPARSGAAQPKVDRRNENMEIEQSASRAKEPLEVVGSQGVAPGTGAGGQEDKEYWRERALRLQAEMENYRKRQQRLAQDEIEAERQRLLRAFLRVVDDLERALQSTTSRRLDGTGHRLGSGTPQAEAVASPANGDRALRQGIELTHRAALQFLQNEGVERFAAEGQPFDPNWHEAVATVSRDGGKATPRTVVQVVEPGYRLGDRLLRPARVVVAV